MLEQLEVGLVAAGGRGVVCGGLLVPKVRMRLMDDPRGYLRRIGKGAPVASHDIFMDGDGVDPAHEYSYIQIGFHYDEDMCQKLQQCVW